jgi:hypothetical protein
MKTVDASLFGLNEHLELTGADGPTPMGRVHVDAAVRYLLRIPTLPDGDSSPAPEGAASPPGDAAEAGGTGPAAAPGCRLEGRDGMWIELRRGGKGRAFRLSMKDGEQNRPIDEMQAANRVRMFIEHWGEETDLTAEIRLSPEQRRRLADLERARDDARRQRVAEGNQVVFRKRVYQVPCLLFMAGAAGLSVALYFLLGPEGVGVTSAAAVLALGSLGALWLLFRQYRVEVDHAIGILRVVAFDGATYVGELDEFRHADVREIAEKEGALGVFVTPHEGAPVPVGRRAWPASDAVAIAEAVNDALDVVEADRKFLAYRRHQGRAPV